MAKVAKTVGTVAGVVAGIALIGSGIGAALGGTMALAGVGSASSIAMVAGAVAGAANMIGGLTQKKPPAVGNTSQIQIGANMPMPYTVGRTYIGGNLVHDVGYGGKVSGVENPYSGTVLIWSGGGPVQEIEAFQADFVTVNFSGTAATGYYAGHLYLAKQLGATPEGSALSPQFSGMPGWGSSSKLSGYCAGLISAKFDKNGKIFASGFPQWGAILKGVKAYDPRKDSTYPGGSGSHRWDDEATWEWTENPSLHALTYARGRYQNDKKVFGCAFPQDGIDLAAFVALANLCDANGWKVGGTIYEPGSRWDNLKRILETAAAEPVFVGARLSVKYSAPKVALDTISADDLADGEYIIPAMKSWKGRLNGLIPRYRSEAHKWEMVQSDLVSVSTYVTEDGEEKEEEYPIELCQQKDQAAQLSAYRLVNGREFGPIRLPCKPRMIEYRPGEALMGGADLDELGLAGVLMVIKDREIDPATGIVTLTLESETTAKHDFALGRTGTAPPTPSITTGAEMDDAVADNRNTIADITGLINTSSQLSLTVTATDSSITLSNHARRYPDKTVAVTGGTVTGLDADTWYYLYYDDIERVGGAVTYFATTDYFSAFPSVANPYRHYSGYVKTDIVGGSGTTGGGALPPGGGGAVPPPGVGNPNDELPPDDPL